MRMHRAKHYILLEQTGELSPRRQAALARFLARSPEAQAFRDDAMRLLDAVRSQPTATPSRATLTRIEREARRVSTEVRDRGRPAIAWQPAWAWAAGVLVAAALVLVIRWPTSPAPDVTRATAPAALAWDDTFEQEIEELDTLYAAASEMSYRTELDAVATALLELEGLEI